MTRREATFDIESKSDAHTARRVAERTYDTLREELRTVADDDPSKSEALAAFETIRDATRSHETGSLTLVYETDDE